MSDRRHFDCQNPSCGYSFYTRIEEGKPVKCKNCGKRYR